MADRVHCKKCGATVERCDCVRVSKPNRETGELIEMTMRPSTLKAKAREARDEAAGAPPNLLGITADERRRIIAGTLEDLSRPHQIDGVEKGYSYILAWDRPKSFADPETKTILTPEASPSCWITVKGITLPEGKGHWTYKLRVEHHGRMVPAYLLKRGSGYTVNGDDAIDEQAAILGEKDLAKISADARQTYADRRDRDAHDRELALKRQLRALREEVNDTMPKLSPLAQQALLAKFHRMLQEAAEGEAEAA